MCLCMLSTVHLYMRKVTLESKHEAGMEDCNATAMERGNM